MPYKNKQASERASRRDNMVNYLYGKDVIHAYPDGWSCISCGTEFTEKTIDIECLYVIHTEEGTECLKCNQQAKG
jgi:hypothetical protein